MHRILVIRGGAIGDFILTLPALKLLRDGFPSAHIEILGYKHIVALAEISGYADATRSIEYSALSSFFSREGELAPELMSYFGSFQQIISYLFDPDEIFATNLARCGVRNLLTGSPKITGREHAARQLARPLERLGLYLDVPVAIIQPNEWKSAAKMDGSFIAIHPGSGSEAKNWPLNNFLELAEWLLAAKENWKLLLIGGEADAGQMSSLERVLPNDRIRIALNLPLPQLATMLQHCQFYIGHDSGISHLAAAVGTPSLLLFGPTDPAIWAPANPQVRIVRSENRTMRGLEVAPVREALCEAF